MTVHLSTLLKQEQKRRITMKDHLTARDESLVNLRSQVSPKSKKTRWSQILLGSWRFLIKHQDMQIMLLSPAKSCSQITAALLSTRAEDFWQPGHLTSVYSQKVINSKQQWSPGAKPQLKALTMIQKTREILRVVVVVVVGCFPSQIILPK